MGRIRKHCATDVQITKLCKLELGVAFGLTGICAASKLDKSGDHLAKITRKFPLSAAY
jgi:hypothetical protein